MEWEERPWGRYKVIYEGRDHKVKRIEVEPFRRLSYQSHEHRMERWMIVEGKATVTLDGTVKVFDVGKVVYVGKRQKHRLANETEELLAIVEVQIGKYLEEDDIVRYEDDFGRVEQ